MSVYFHITEDQFDETKTNPHFTYFLMANGHTPGERVPMWEFTAWISQEYSKVMKAHGFQWTDPSNYLPNDIKTFTEHLRKLAYENSKPIQITLFEEETNHDMLRM